MNTLLSYPPHLEGKIPAFMNSTLRVPFQLSRAVSRNDFDEMEVLIKTVSGGRQKYHGTTTTINYDLNTQSYYAIFNLGNKHDLLVGQFYKIQIAFKNSTSISAWSSVAIAKYTKEPIVEIQGLNAEGDNVNKSSFIGSYKTEDITEKVYSYCFTIYDEQGNLFETSGELIHNSLTDVNREGVWVSEDTWTQKKTFEQNLRYKIVYSVKTINGWEADSGSYYIKNIDTIDAKIHAKLLATPDFDNGCITLELIDENEKNPEAISGKFVISRYSDKTKIWEEIFRFSMQTQTPSDFGVLWTDYTIEHGVKYIYSLQAYNGNGLYSNRMYHVLKNLDIYNNKDKYLETDKDGNPYPIMADFEDAFLVDGKRQLKIRFNPKVSSFKPTILETKVDTLGGKYPFVFRNGNVNYKEFPISGLLSYLGDEKELFIKGVLPETNELKRGAAAGQEIPEAGAKLTSDNFYRERQFKMAALDWLTDGKPKLFRSPGEGNYIVRLTNVSLSPNETLGRMLHTFSATAYEIADCTMENLNDLELAYIPIADERTMKFTEMILSENCDEDGVFDPSTGNMYYAYITDASPYSEYELYFDNAFGAPSARIIIGATGAYHLPDDTPPLSKIQKISGDINNTAKIHYGYYDYDTPDYFSQINEITPKDEIVQIIGYNDSVNIIEDKLEDIRREVGRFYSIVARMRPTFIVYYNSSDQKYYKDLGFKVLMEENDWIDTNIYYVYQTQKYYSGYPSKITELNGSPDRYMKVNDEYIIDLESGNSYNTDDTIGVLADRSKPVSNDRFTQISQGSYYITHNLNNIKSLHLSIGVYVELSYEVKEITYVVEETNALVKITKETWLELKSKFEAGDEEVTKSQVDAAYNNFITKLQAAIQEQAKQEGNYAI